MKTLKFRTKSWSDYYKSKIKKQGLQKYYISKISKNKPFLNIVEKFAKKTKKNILETGLGTSFFLVYLSKKGHRCHGLDLEKNIINFGKTITKSFKTSIMFHQKNMIHTDFQNKQFGVSFNLGVMEHFTDEEIIKTIREQTRIADYYIFSVPSVNVLRPNSMYFGDERYMSAKKWESLIKKANAKIVHKIGYRFEYRKMYEWANKFFGLFYSKATFLVYAVSK